MMKATINKWFRKTIQVAEALDYSPSVEVYNEVARLHREVQEIKSRLEPTADADYQLRPVITNTGESKSA